MNDHSFASPHTPALPAQRFIGWAVDTAVVYVVSIAGLGVAVAIGQAAEWTDDGYRTTLAACWVTYYVVLERTVGRTVGKFVTATRVVYLAPGRPKLLMVMARTAARCIPFEAISILYCGRAAHDAFSNTCVVRCPAAESVRPVSTA